MVDEALKHDTASLWRGGPSEAPRGEVPEPEGPAEGEPTPDARLQGGGEIPGTGLSLDDLNGRADLARYLEHRQFPARPDELIAHARARHAPDAVVDQLRSAPDRVYETVTEVWAALGGRVERPRSRADGHD